MIEVVFSKSKKSWKNLSIIFHGSSDSGGHFSGFGGILWGI